MEPIVAKPEAPGARRFLSSPVPGVLWIVLLAGLVVFVHGIVLSIRGPAQFQMWARPQGPLAWIGFAVCLLGALYAACVSAGHGEAKDSARMWIWLAIVFVLAGFAALLMFGGVRGGLLAVVALAWTIVAPILSRKTERVPVPQLYQAILLALVIACGLLLEKHSEDRIASLADVAAGFVVLAVLAHPSARPGRPVPVFGAIDRLRARAWAAWLRGFRRLPKIVRFGILLVAINVAIYTALRGLFWTFFAPIAILPDGATIAEAWYIGLKFDVRVAIAFFFPILLLGWIPGLRSRRVWLGYLALAGFFVFLMHAIDLGHYAYVNERLNAHALDELQNAQISFKVAWKSYPIVPAFLGLFALTAAYAWVLWKTAFRELDQETVPVSRWGRVATVGPACLAMAFGMFGNYSISRYPLRWSDAYFTTNSFAAALALNPVHFFFDTLHLLGGQKYDLELVRKHYPEVAAYLGVEKPDVEKLEFAREVRPKPRWPGRKPNVVIIFLESFASFKTGVGGNPLDPTPHFDAMARQSVYFPHFFVPCGPTGRSIYSALFGFPDVNPNKSASRNPQAVRQRTIVNAFEGYEKFYFIGVSAAWADIRAMVCHNIPDVQMYEEGKYEGARTSTWGAHDLFFLEEVHKILRKRTGPFFAIIQTSGNHKPWDIPADKRDFQLAHREDAELKRAGFVDDSIEAYNSIRFMDYSLGNFFRLARQEPWFQDTVFVLFGDHGTSDTPGVAEVQIRLRRRHVPMIIYAPALLEPRVEPRVASSLDVLPTVAGLAGVPYTNWTFGHDLFDPRPERYAIVDDDWNYGLLDDEHYLYVLNHRVQGLFAYRSGDPVRDRSAEFPEKVARMASLSRGFHEISRWLLYHNRPR